APGTGRNLSATGLSGSASTSEANRWGRRSLPRAGSCPTAPPGAARWMWRSCPTAPSSSPTTTRGSSTGSRTLPALDLLPRIPEGDDPVEDQEVFRAVGVHREVAVAEELVPGAHRRPGQPGLHQAPGEHLEGVGVQVGQEVAAFLRVFG